MSGSTRAIDVIITIDTEADNQWETGHPIETRNLEYVQRFQELCDRFGLKPTYLCTYEIAIAPEFESLVSYQKAGTAEIAAHLHPWSNPPLPGDEYDLHSRPFPSELADGVFREKMAILTETLAERAGRRPVSYRAGRWGFRASHVPVLLDLGYKVDCSVTPLVTWNRQRGVNGFGPDFRAARQEPYFLDQSDVCRPGGSGLLEVPMTILCRREAPLRAINRVFRDEASFGSRAFRKALGLDVEWFRPYPYMTAADLKAVYTLAANRGLPAVTLMFHSSELMPGGSPYNPTPESIEQLYERFESLFEFVTAREGRGATLREFAQRFAGAGA